MLSENRINKELLKAGNRVNKGVTKAENRINKEILKERLRNETFKSRTLSFYRYVTIEDPVAFRNNLYYQWFDLNCFGRIYVAHEGINAQMSVPEDFCDKHTNCANDACHILFIQCTECASKYDSCCSNECVALKNVQPESGFNLKGNKRPRYFKRKFTRV